MSDLSKCTGYDGERTCPLREACRRYTAEANARWQSWIRAPYDPEDESCHLYIPNQEGNESDSLRLA